MSRLLLVSNRLPVKITEADGRLKIEPTAGGLATGLRRPHEEMGGSWIGWLGGPPLPTSLAADVEEQLAALNAVPIELSQAEIDEYYEQFSNQVLWPTFHYQLGRRSIDPGGWETYCRVNARFADAIASQYQPGDLIWVHDYHLMLVPSLVRERLPEAKIGFFLHIPFPSSEVFSSLPWRKELLQGLLGASLIGFHSPSYLRHFSTSMRRVLGLELQLDHVRWREREVHVGAFPLGVDAEGLSRAALTPQVAERAAAFHRDAPVEHLLVGIDRLDYTKGIPRRLLAIDRLLERHPEHVEQIRFVQISAPSRETTEAYVEFRKEVDEIVGRVNAKWATPAWMPINHVYRALAGDDISVLFQAADVMVVTPIRDGMNLVAMEFVASRPDGDGVLVLSEFAGAASELGPALHVNPYDIDAIADRMHQALVMPEAERRSRMKSMRTRVMFNTAQRWAEIFLDRLRSTEPEHQEQTTDLFEATAAALEANGRLHLLLDYDGTLVPFAALPHLAPPDAELLALLGGLSSKQHLSVELVSGRPKETLEQWFGSIPLGLHAEHGLWSRWPGAKGWKSRAHFQTAWKGRVRAILEQFTESTPGSLIEEKTASLAWHYRLATADYIGDQDFGEYQARELRQLLHELLSNEPIEIILGSRVVEIRPHGVNKGVIVPELLSRPSESLMGTVAIGDDLTDEDLYAVLPPPAITINVGSRKSASARFALRDYQEVRAFLAAIGRLAH